MLRIRQVDRDMAVINDLGVKLVYGANTHCHVRARVMDFSAQLTRTPARSILCLQADHVTGTGELKKRIPGMRSAIAAASGADADVKFAHGDVLSFGAFRLEVRATPGHTDGCVCFVLPGCAVFTGDAVLIRGCGRTDFQQGDAGHLYDNVHAQVFSLPPNTRIYPAHDYKGATSCACLRARRLR